MKDMHSGVKVETAIAAATLDADNTPPAVDLQDFNAAEIILAIGAGGITFSGANKIEFVLTHSDDNSTYTAVDIDDVLGVASVGAGGIVKALIAAHATAASYRLGYVGGKRYIKLLADFSGTHGTGTPIAAVAVLGEPYDAPVADQI